MPTIENLGHAIVIITTLICIGLFLIVTVSYAVRVGIQLSKEVDSGMWDYVYDDEPNQSTLKNVQVVKEPIACAVKRKPLNQPTKKTKTVWQSIKNH